MTSFLRRLIDVARDQYLPYWGPLFSERGPVERNSWAAIRISLRSLSSLKLLMIFLTTFLALMYYSIYFLPNLLSNLKAGASAYYLSWVGHLIVFFIMIHFLWAVGAWLFFRAAGREPQWKAFMASAIQIARMAAWEIPIAIFGFILIVDFFFNQFDMDSDVYTFSQRYIPVLMIIAAIIVAVRSLSFRYCVDGLSQSNPGVGIDKMRTAYAILVAVWAVIFSIVGAHGAILLANANDLPASNLAVSDFDAFGFVKLIWNEWIKKLI